MRLMTYVIVAVSLAVVLETPVDAGIIFDNGVTHSDINHGAISDRKVTVTNLSGEDFVLSSAAVLQEFRWTGFYSGGIAIAPATDDFTIALYDFSGATPSFSAFHTVSVGNAVNRVDTGNLLRLVGDPIYEFRATIPDYSIGPGRYLVAIQTDTSLATGDFFNWAAASPGNSTSYSRFGNTISAWASNTNYDLDVTIYGTAAAVPEPSSFLLALVALTAIAWCRIRTGKNAAPIQHSVRCPSSFDSAATR
jgi:hypothetical protein